MKLSRRIHSWIQYRRNLQEYREQCESSGEFPITRRPCLRDRFEASGTASGHYFHQDILVAQSIFEHRPKRHVDIGSRIDGFVAHVASFREIEVLDIRDQTVSVRNIIFTKANIMDLDASFDGYTDSLSCLHALEHFGLGRYGDAVLADGHVRALANMTRVLRPGGRLYLSIPIGMQRVEFDAHRIFSVQYMLELLLGDYDLQSFSYVTDKGDLVRDVRLAPESARTSLGCMYGCGIFFLRKRESSKAQPLENSSA